MVENLQDENKVIQNDEGLYNTKIKSQPNPQAKDINVDILHNIINGVNSQLDISKIEAFSQISMRRDQLYNLIDEMAMDPTVAAVLETYAEDATEYNEEGKIIWSESDDPKVNKYITFLIDTLQLDKHMYEWVHSMCKYGDLYLQLYKESEYKKDAFFDKPNNNILKETVKLKAFSKNDNYIHYIEAIPNPAELFELTKFGKTAGYIKTTIGSNSIDKDNILGVNSLNYRFRKSDVDLYGNDKFVHAMLDGNGARSVEKVDLFLDQSSLDEDKGYSYSVKRGQSILYNIFKIWRELSLLENSILLNRITKSAIVRTINVEVGDMDKSMVGPHLQGVKALMEQKSAISAGGSMNEYTNPGPIENNIYVPTYNGKGAITANQIGGDVNITNLPDIDYFQNKFFGSMRIPKQYFGLTDDGAGFSGGQSLAIISSRYAKLVKRIQNSIIQALTSVINLLLIDKGLESYINKFTLKMQPPTTQEEIDRRDNLASKVQIVNDIMNLLSDIDDNVTKISILKSLLSTIITDTEVISLIDEYINKLENEDVETPLEKEENLSDESEDNFNIDNLLNTKPEINIPEVETEENEENNLPTPEETGLDMTDNNIEI